MGSGEAAARGKNKIVVIRTSSVEGNLREDGYIYVRGPKEGRG
jgi:hypothetical protein